MKLYCLADSHGLFPESKPDADIALVCGDFSDFGRGYEVLFENLGRWRIPVYFTSGNHESRALCEAIADTYEAVCLDYSWEKVGELFLAGVGGYDIFDHAGRERRVENFVRQLHGLQIHPMPKYSILLTHEPPWPWKYHGKVRGKNFLRNVLRAWSFNLVLTGHFHEDIPKIECESTIQPTLNPSFDGCLVEIDCSNRLFKVMP